MIRIKLGHVLLDRGMTLTRLSEKTGIALNNLSIMKTNKAKAIRLSTLNLICRETGATPGELLEFVPEDEADRKPF